VLMKFPPIFGARRIQTDCTGKSISRGLGQQAGGNEFDLKQHPAV
jgi:hypothetical protein